MQKIVESLTIHFQFLGDIPNCSMKVTPPRLHHITIRAKKKPLFWGIWVDLQLDNLSNLAFFTKFIQRSVICRSLLLTLNFNTVVNTAPKWMSSRSLQLCEIILNTSTPQPPLENHPSTVYLQYFVVSHLAINAGRWLVAFRLPYYLNRPVQSNCK